MHISSLPGPYGIGTMGDNAYRFVDFLQRAGQTWWQILPIGPTSYGDSPYQSFSSVAGNPYFIDLPQLERDGLLERDEYERLPWCESELSVDYGQLYQLRYEVLHHAYRRFAQNQPEDYAQFCRENERWLPDYALFMALKDAHGGRPWNEWEQPLKTREPGARFPRRSAGSPPVGSAQSAGRRGAAPHSAAGTAVRSPPKVRFRTTAAVHIHRAPAAHPAPAGAGL